jgi:hypothetical protein
MKIHCAQLVEDALRSALDPEASQKLASQKLAPGPLPSGPTLSDQITPAGKVKITISTPPASR